MLRGDKMLITNVILSLLSFNDMSGYEIKKKIQETIYYPWSGNNNQIYKALSELSENELVTSESVIQEKTPAKKVYKITLKGREQLKEYAKSEFNTMQLSKPFLIRLLSATNLNEKELKALIGIYRNQLLVDLNKIQNKHELNKEFSTININEFLLKWVNKNELMTLENELQWLDELEKDLNVVEFITNEKIFNTDNKNLKFNYEVKQNNLLYSVKVNGTNNLFTEKNIKDITIDVIENNCTGLIIERSIIDTECFTKELLELLDFELKKYNINFEII